MDKDFEKEFEKFIEQNKFENTEESALARLRETVVEIAHEAFKAGWLAAGGVKPK